MKDYDKKRTDYGPTLSVMPIFRKFSEFRKSENSAKNFRKFSGTEKYGILSKYLQKYFFLTDIYQIHKLVNDCS